MRRLTNGTANGPQIRSKGVIYEFIDLENHLYRICGTVCGNRGYSVRNAAVKE